MDSLLAPASVPSSEIHLGHVRWDSSYRDFRLYDSESAQNAAILAMCPAKYTQLNNYFVRPYKGTVNVPFTSDELAVAGINYIAFRNSTSSKWWYAFVQQIAYVNDTVCQLVFELDRLQTWWFSLRQSACFVEREHASTDEPGDNLLDEPVDTGEFAYGSIEGWDDLKEYVAVVSSAEEPVIKANDTFEKQNSLGGWSDTIYEGSGLYIFDGTVVAFGKTLLGFWLNALNSAGGGNSVSAIFLYPKKLCPVYTPGANVFGTKDDYHSQVNPVQLNRRFTFAPELDGYTPRNKKLYTYPYNFVRVSNNQGNYHDYRLEFFAAKILNGVDFQARGALDPSGDLLIQPYKYNGSDGYNMQEAFNYGGYPQCTWTYDGYANWRAQNSGSITANAIMGGAMVAVGVAGLATGAAALGGAGAAAGLVAGGAGTIGEVAGAGSVGSALAGTFGGSGGGAVLGSLAGGVGSLMRQQGTILDASKAPSKVMSKTSNAALAGIGFGMFTVCHMTVRRQFAERIDQFFDVYGYNTQRTKVPNYTGRRSWNYVKTRNSTLTGSAPAADVALINAAFDSGVTCWHTDDIGNYSLDNSIA